MAWNPRLTDLRNHLASLFPVLADSVIIVEDAGLPRSFIDFSGKAISNWHGILSEADRRDKVGDIVRAALAAYPGDPVLRRAQRGDF